MWFVGTDFWLLLVAALCMVVCFWFAEKHEARERKRRDRKAVRQAPLGTSSGRGFSEIDGATGSGAPSDGHIAHLIAAEVPVSEETLAALKRIHGRKP